jgi:hypothetical protein
MLESSESKFQKWYKRFLARPHQPMFVLGFFQAFFTIFVLFFVFIGIINIDIKFFHAINIALFMPLSFFLGFLMTVLYRFLGEIPYLQKEYMRVFWPMFLGFLLTNIGIFYTEIAIEAGLFLALISVMLAVKMFASTYINSKLDDKFDPFWIIALFSTSMIGILAFMYSIYRTDTITFAINFTFYIFTVSTVFFVSQKMVPNFYGFYFNFDPPARQKTLTLLVVGSLLGVVLSKIIISTYLLFISNSAYFTGIFSRISKTNFQNF